MGTPTLTPDGHKYDPKNPLTIGDCWLTSSDYPNLVAYTQDSVKAPFVNQYIIEACAAVNTMCNRYFNQQTIDQIFKDKVLNIRDYTTFVLDYAPVASITSVWVQVVNTFAPIDPVYFQLLTRESTVKILPQFSVYVATTLPQWALPTSTNVWIRYVGGYLTSSGDAYQIPPDVKRATALYVDYLFGIDSLTPNVSSFRTQTYSETAATIADDPILTRVQQLLKPYRLFKTI